MREIITAILVIAGALVVLIASVGIVRFGNLYARTHVVTKVSSFALMLFLIAVNIWFMDIWVLVVSLIIFHVVIVLAPVGAHVISKVSRTIGEQPGVNGS
ncbi:MAG: monovalent cation/H(+) antiporter subunit G [Bacteroidales bacterium]|jgi:monovalent cation/proton antiporter MnhG/PhaG subunit|nr:monovalent cation/H(+) antiporter subunit G [Bacteroidales bacterium]